jgi:hypothetical protein
LLTEDRKCLRRKIEVVENHNNVNITSISLDLEVLMFLGRAKAWDQLCLRSSSSSSLDLEVLMFRQSQSMGSAMPMQQQPPQEASYEQPNGGPNGDGNGTILDTMAQGFVAGAPQQVGQMVVQSVINPDADGDSTGNNNNRDPNGGANNYCNPSVIITGPSTVLISHIMFVIVQFKEQNAIIIGVKGANYHQ